MRFGAKSQGVGTPQIGNENARPTLLPDVLCYIVLQKISKATQKSANYHQVYLQNGTKNESRIND